MKIHCDGERRSFHCPGCEEDHTVNASWGWNGSVDAPTFTPSVLVTCGHYAPHWKPGDNCWCTFNAEHADDPSSFACHRCHSFVTDGRIQFLADSTHKLAGLTIDLPDW